MILSLSSLSLFLFPSLFLHSLTAHQKTRQLSLRAFKKRKAKDNFTHKLRKREKKKKIKIFLIFVMHAFSYWDQNQRIFYPRKNFEGKDLSPLLNQNTPQSYSHKTKKIRTTKLKIWTKKKKMQRRRSDQIRSHAQSLSKSNHQHTPPQLWKPSQSTVGTRTTWRNKSSKTSRSMRKALDKWS